MKFVTVDIGKMDGMAIAGRGKVYRVLKKEYRRRVADLVTAGPESITGGLIIANPRPYSELVNDIWNTAANWFYADTVRQIGRKKLSGLALDRLRRYLLTYGLEKAKQMDTTTQDQIRGKIADMVDEGLTVREMAQALAVWVESITATRAEVIIRTEITAAANWSSLLAVDETGLEYRKTWLSARQPGRTRPWHYAAHGQTVNQGAPFLVLGERLGYPGDTSLGASAKNVVRCRCSLRYEIDETQI